MSAVQHSQTFGKQSLPHTLVIARGEKVRHFTIRPWVLALSTAIVSTLSVATIGAATYLVFHDDLAASAIAYQGRLRNSYEGRIATLRTQLDLVVSRQLLDQKKVRSKVDVLLDQQVELASRYDKLQPLLDRARLEGLLSGPVPIPQPKPDAAADAASRSGERPAEGALSFAGSGNQLALERFRLIEGAPGSQPVPALIGTSGLTEGEPGDRLSPDLIREIGRAMETVNDRQIEDVNALADVARAKSANIATALRSEGIPLNLPVRDPKAEASGQGGPFEPVPEELIFEAGCNELDAALTELQTLKDMTRQLPLEKPIATHSVSSPFGARSDPFFKRIAMHTGIDFTAEAGTPVTTTADGTVVTAGPNGGYGQMVEIDHGGGVVTRYAHLSMILVDVGQSVSAGTLIGKVGSTGRSTGPHLHYEVRRDGQAVDPSPFLRAGRKIA